MVSPNNSGVTCNPHISPRPHRVILWLLVFTACLLPGGCSESATSLSDNLPRTDADPRVFILPTETCGTYFIAQTFLDGHGPYAMLLDTGATTTVISPSVVRTAHLSSKVRRIEFGELQLVGRAGYITRDVDHLGDALGVEIDGIIGHDVFRTVLLTYDYPALEIRVRTGAITDDLPGIAPMSTGKRPFLGAMIGKRKTNVLLDTGSESGLSLAKFLDQHFVDSPRHVGGRVRINGLYMVRAGRLTDDVRFGSFVLEQPVVRDAVGASLLGQEILKNYVVTIDQQRGRVQIVRPDSTAIDEPVSTPSLYGTGWVLRPLEDRGVIEHILPGSAAELAGVQKGDAIVAVDGVPWTERGCSSRETSNTQPKQAVFRIDRDGERFDVDVTTTVFIP